MIALDMELPKNCANCPCFATLTAMGEKQYDEWFIKRCMVSGKIIKRWLWQGDDVEQAERPDDWDDFTRPEWCPWINLDCKE